MRLPTGSLIAVGVFGLGVYTGVRLAHSDKRIDALVAKVLDRFASSVYDEWWKN